MANPPAEWLEGYDSAKQGRFLVARARALDANASGELPPQYAKQRKEMLEAAINLWSLVIQDGQDDKAVDDGQRRLPKLKTMLMTGDDAAK